MSAGRTWTRPPFHKYRVSGTFGGDTVHYHDKKSHVCRRRPLWQLSPVFSSPARLSLSHTHTHALTLSRKLSTQEIEARHRLGIPHRGLWVYMCMCMCVCLVSVRVCPRIRNISKGLSVFLSGGRASPRIYVISARPDFPARPSEYPPPHANLSTDPYICPISLALAWDVMHWRRRPSDALTFVLFQRKRPKSSLHKPLFTKFGKFLKTTHPYTFQCQFGADILVELRSV